METQLTIHHGADHAHLLKLDDTVITNWAQAVDDDQCDAMPSVLLTLMEEALRWRANRRTRPSDIETRRLRWSPAIPG